MIIVPPLTAYQFAMSSWPFGDFACRAMHYVVNVIAYVTVYTLVLVAVLRYMTIVHDNATVRFVTMHFLSISKEKVFFVTTSLSVALLYHSMGQIIKSVVVCLCMYVSVDMPTVAFLPNLHEIWQELLGSEKEELIRLGSKSENTFPYFNPPKQKNYRRSR